jgi:hypothetical protein
MNSKTIVLTLALGLAACLVYAQNNNPPPGGQRPPARPGLATNPGGPGGPGGPGAPGFRIVPPPMAERLNLTPDQERQIAALEAEIKTKLEKSSPLNKCSSSSKCARPAPECAAADPADPADPVAPVGNAVLEIGRKLT